LTRARSVWYNLAIKNLKEVRPMNLSRLKRIFLSFMSYKRESRKRTVKDVVRRYSRGNVNLQLGRIMTVKDYELRRKKVLSYEFA
jgi:hypothetical protein